MGLFFQTGRRVMWAESFVVLVVVADHAIHAVEGKASRHHTKT